MPIVKHLNRPMPKGAEDDLEKVETLARSVMRDFPALRTLALQVSRVHRT
jgi:hypothetical protein